MIAYRPSRQNWYDFLSDKIEALPDIQWCAATLSLSASFQVLRRDENERKKYAVTSCFRVFLKKVNRAFLGNAFRRFGKTLHCISVIESQKDGRLHIHALLEIPHYINTEEARKNFFDTLINIARHSDGFEKGRHGQFCVKPVPDMTNAKKWLDYLLKNVTSDRDIVDLNNISLTS